MPFAPRCPKRFNVKAKKWELFGSSYIAVGPREIPFETSQKIRVRHTSNESQPVRELEFDKGKHIFKLPIHYNRIEIYSEQDATITWGD